MANIEAIHEIQSHRILQHGELPVAIPIDTESLSSEEVQSLILLGESTCFKRYFAVAGTQISDSTLDYSGVNKSKRNFIYINGNESFKYSQLLLINPQVFIPEDTDYFPMAEVCGSIDQSTSVMICRRPINVHLRALKAAEDGSLIPIEAQLKGPIAGIMHHEHEHLRGHTALSTPSQLINPYEISTDEIELLNTYAANKVFTLPHILDLVSEFPRMKWIIPQGDRWAYAQ